MVMMLMTRTMAAMMMMMVMMMMMKPRGSQVRPLNFVVSCWVGASSSSFLLALAVGFFFSVKL